jgi:nucleotide-binding universal stress UspA family protein
MIYELIVILSSQINSKFTKILVAIDGSKESMDAADYAIDLAKQYNASLNIVHILPQEIRYTYNVDILDPEIPATASPLKGIVELSRHEVEEKWFSKIRDKAKENNVGLQTDVIVATRSIVAEIVGYAESENVNLMVIGTRGRSGLKRMFLGSVASGVVTYAHCPVLVVK